MTPAETPTSPAEGVRCAACGRFEKNGTLRFCRACGAPLAATTTWLERAKLDFLIGEIRLWRDARRLPEPEVSGLLAEYAARRAAVDAPPPVPAAISAPPPAAPEPLPVAAPPASEPAPARNPVAGLTAFLEERNIAVLHIIGSLLLVAGLIALVQWQWATIGRGVLLAMLLALTVGLYGGGRRLSPRHPVSGLVLSALGALIAPLNIIAANQFRLFGPVHDWDGVGLATALVCTGLYAATLCRTRHPLFAAFVTAAGACAGFFAARLLLPGHAHLTYAAAFLPLCAVYFATAYRLCQTEEDRLGLPFLAAGHLLAGATALLTLANWPSIWTQGPQATALVVGVLAVLYGALSVVFGLPMLAFAASAAGVAAIQLLPPPDASLHERAALLALAGTALHLAACLHRRNLPEEGTASCAASYRLAALLSALAALLPVTAALAAGYLTLRPVTEARVLAAMLVVAVAATGIFGDAARRERRPVLLYPALLAALLATAAFLALAAPRWTWLPAAGIPLLIFAAGAVSAALLLRRLGQGDFAGPCDHAALAAMVTAALIPWLSVFAADGNLALSLREANPRLVLPGLAALGLLAARQNTAFLHAAALALGSLALFLGVAAGVPPAERALLAGRNGAVLAVAMGIAALPLPRLRQALSRDTAALAGVSTLPLLPLLLTAEHVLPVAGILGLLAAAWTLAANGHAAPALLYPAAGSLLAALRLAAGPLNDGGIRAYGWEPNETRWLLALVPGFALSGYAARRFSARPEWAMPLYHGAIAAAVWAGAGQIALLFGATPRLAASPTLTLWLLAAGIGLYGAITQRLHFVGASLVPALAGLLGFLAAGSGTAATLSVWLAVAALTVFGACYLWVAWEHGAPIYAVAGGLSLFAAYRYALLDLLPEQARPFQALCLAPFFLVLFVGAQWAGRDADGDRAVRRPLHALAFGLSAACLALFLAVLIRDNSRFVLETARAALLLTTLTAAAFYAAAAFVRDSRLCLGMAIATATIGVTLRITGYPQPTLSLAATGFWGTVLAASWLGAAPLLAARGRLEFAEVCTRAALLVATVGAALALLGVTTPEQGRWTVFALLVAGTLCAAVGLLRQRLAEAHAAFAAYFAAFALFLYDRAGLHVGTADFYLIPVGLYLIVIGWLVVRVRPDAGGARAAQQLYGAGLLIALTPTFLAAWLDTAWWHSFLLIAECLGAVYFGIARRVRVFLGIGAAFLLALLGVKAYDPLRQVNFAIYLTLLGAAVIASAVFFDRRREDVLRWARATRAALDDWD